MIFVFSNSTAKVRIIFNTPKLFLKKKNVNVSLRRQSMSGPVLPRVGLAFTPTLSHLWFHFGSILPPFRFHSGFVKKNGDRMEVEWR